MPGKRPPLRTTTRRAAIKMFRLHDPTAKSLMAPTGCGSASDGAAETGNAVPTPFQLAGFQRCVLPLPAHGITTLVVTHGFGMLVCVEETQRFTGPCTIRHKGGACEVVNLGATTLELRLHASTDAHS
jgi:hypothetical protein